MSDAHPEDLTEVVEADEIAAAAHGELGRIANKLYDEDASTEESFMAFMEWCESRGIELWPHQEEALMDIMVGDHVILGTPTGSGKSLVALGMHFMAMCFGERSYYTAPIKALVSEKFFNLVELLGRDNVGMITGDVHINVDAPVICCTAEILANLALREGAAAQVHSVAADEFHYFSDFDRGWAWQVPLLTLPKTQFLLMSATLGDVDEIAATLQRQTGNTVSRVMNAPRPVPLSYEYVKTPIEATVELALRAGEGPMYLVHFSQDAALSTASALASYGVATKAQREAVKEAMKGTAFTTAFGKTLKRLLGFGVGVHHAGMLPRYRLLVEKLAQQGLLPVICGTDTLGVGINVPIHTVVFTQLTKFDGYKMRRLRSREFHQIAGRAGRSGFDSEGRVLAEAPEHEIENYKAMVKAGGDEKKLRRIKKKKAPEGFVNWSEQTFDHLIESQPEKLTPRLRITHSMVLSVVEQGGDARARVEALIDDSMQTPEEKIKLSQRADEVFATLIDADVVERSKAEDGGTEYVLTMDLPDDFALDQPLSPFLLAALELLDPESETYALDAVSMVEATLENPRQVLRAQERKARDKAMAEMKMDGVDYDERVERIAEVTYPKPLEDLLNSAFAQYCEKVPWARDFELSPKSVLRDMLETVSVKSFEDGAKVILIPNAEKMNAAAQNCLLKTLEEPPEATVFFLMTDQPAALLPTVVSRCRVVRFHPLSVEDCAARLVALGERADDAAKKARMAEGCVGRALEIDEQQLSLRQQLTRDVFSVHHPADILPVVNAYKEDKERQKQAMDTLECAVRDILVAQAGGMSLADAGYDRQAQSYAAAVPLSGGLALMEKVTHARMMMQSNVAFASAMESVLLQISEEYAKWPW